jgi:hypothetical protein
MLGRALEAGVPAGWVTSFPGERYRRIARRRGSKKAIVAVGRSSWSSSGTCSRTPKPTTPTWAAVSRQRISRKRAHIHQLEALGYRVTLEPAA